MFIDTHSHISSEYYDDIDGVIKRALENKIEKIIINGCDLASNKEVLELINKYEILYGAIGFHPTELDKYCDDDLLWLEKNISNNKIVAIGEIGLDYHYDNTDKELQKKVFIKQLQLAEKYDLPVVVHSRDSIQDTYDILKQFKVRGEIHCFSSSIEMAREFIKLGFYLGVGGIISFKNAKTIKEVVKNIDLSHIILETDAPYLAPEPYRGRQNEAMYIPIIATEIGNIKNMDYLLVGKVTTDNAYTLFDKMAK